MIAVIVVVFSAVIVIVSSVPLDNRRVVADPELTAGYFEGDIVLKKGRNGMRDSIARWPNNTVFYKIQNRFFDADHISYILKAMRAIEQFSCIRFEDVSGTDEPHYVSIAGYPTGCYSELGYMRRVQMFNLAVNTLDNGCFRLGSIVHEFFHTLGFYHMQSDSNRDKYVKILNLNIRDGMHHNFLKYEENVVDNFDQEYDYASIMHYSANAFAKPGTRSIIPIIDNEASRNMGQRRFLTKSDVNKLNIMYKCLKIV